MTMQMPVYHGPCWSCETTSRIIDSLPLYLEELEKCDPFGMDTEQNRNTLHTRVPQEGVYAFYRGCVPVYVGRSDGLSHRILQHSRRGTRPDSAPVATRIAKEEMNQEFDDAFPIDNEEIDQVFDDAFASAKDDIRAMKVRAVAIQCPNVQAIFEVYAHVVLGHTRYNSFMNS